MSPAGLLPVIWIKSLNLRLLFCYIGAGATSTLLRVVSFQNEITDSKRFVIHQERVNLTLSCRFWLLVLVVFRRRVIEDERHSLIEADSQ